MRDITLGETFYHFFTTRAFATGVPTSLLGTPVLSVLEENNITPITAGVSVAVDRASVTGLNQATIVATAGNGFEAGKSYAIYISTGTVGGTSVIGEVVGEFTIQASAAFTRLGAPAGASVSADILAIDNLVDDLESRLGTPSNLGSGATVAANLVDIEGQTDDIGVAGAGLTAIPWNAAWDAEVQSEATDALNAYDPPTKAEQDTAFTEIKGATWSAVTDTLELIRDKETDIETDTQAIQANTDNLPSAVKKNTARRLHFYMVLASDHVTPATGLTVTAQRALDAGAFAGAAGAVTEVSAGYYYIDAAAGDLNGDSVAWKMTAATADPCPFSFLTEP